MAREQATWWVTRGRWSAATGTCPSRTTPSRRRCSAALFGRDGTIDWLCAPRFDATPLFASLLDARIGGHFAIELETLTESQQHYLDGTPILVTELRSPTGVIGITDVLTLRKGADLTEDASACRGELVRKIRVLEGEVRLRIHLEPFGGATWAPHGESARLTSHRQPQLDLRVGGSLGISERDQIVTLRQHDERFALLRWGGGSLRPALPTQR